MKTLITREMLITEIAKRCDYFKQDVRRVFNEFDDLVEEYLYQVNEENDDVSIQVVRGLRLQGRYIKERARRDPRTNEQIMCAPTIKVHGKVSETIKEKVQKAYEDSKNG